ncbi:MAG: hypothetical protein GKS00_00865 [Alphaproteobacteria bacterium]|nr:hypothetical protein [Alphaproteobacteria bacterium]
MTVHPPGAFKGNIRPIHGRVLALILWVSVGLACIAGPTDARADARKDIESILSGQDYQRAMPQPKAPVTVRKRIPFKLGPVANFLMWVVVAVGAVLLVVYLIKHVPNMRWRATSEPKESQAAEIGTATNTPIAETAESLFDRIERLAREGAFGDAVHLLLLHCFADLRQASPLPRDPALTSREVLARLALPVKTMESLAFIISAVEVGYFGHRKINRSVYERCLDEYRAIVKATAQ